MSDDVVNVPGLPSASTKAIDSSSLTVNAAVVLRQRINVADPSDPLGLALVASGDLLGTDYGLGVRPVMRSEAQVASLVPRYGIFVGGDDGSGNFEPLLFAGSHLQVVVQSEGTFGNFGPSKALQVAGIDTIGDLAPFKIVGNYLQVLSISDGTPGSPPPNNSATFVAGIDDSGNLAAIPVINGQIPVSVQSPLGVSGNVLVINTVSISGTVSVQPVSSGTIFGVRPATPSVSSLLHVRVDIQVSGDTVLVAGVGGQTIRVMRGLLTLFSSGGIFNIVKFEDSTPQDLSGPLYFFDGGLALDHSGEPWYITAVGKSLILSQTQIGQIGGDIWYTQS